MEAWYKQQTFFVQARLDRIKDWMEPGYNNLINMQEFKEAS